MKHKRYWVVIDEEESKDVEAIHFLRKHVKYNKNAGLKECREKARAMMILFPGIVVRVFGKDRRFVAESIQDFSNKLNVPIFETDIKNDEFVNV